MCGHMAVFVRGSGRYSICCFCGQVRMRYDYKPLIHNGKKRRK